METPNIVETNLNFRNGVQERGATNLIVIHHVGGTNRDVSAQEIHGWHQNQGWSGIGYHFVIRKDGTIERGRPQDTIGAHAYGYNSDSIGINVAGTFDTEAPTTEQIESLSMLIAYLCDTYGFIADAEHVCAHRDLMETDCCGDVLYNMLDVVRGKAEFYRVE